MREIEEKAARAFRERVGERPVLREPVLLALASAAALSLSTPGRRPTPSWA